MAVLMWHPVTGGTFEAADDDAAAHHRQSGWLRADERDEHLARIAAHPSQAPPDEKKAAKSASKTDGS